MKYYEILYENCFGNRYVALKAASGIHEFINHCFAGVRIIGYCETNFDSYRHNKIKWFKDYNFSTASKGERT